MAEPTPRQREFRAAMANLSAAVSVVTTDGPLGRAGMTWPPVRPAGPALRR